MKFDFNLEEKVLHNKHEYSLILIKKLEILRDSFLKEYEKDDTGFFNTLREIIYMFHFVNGFITQVSDDTMQSMYDTLVENPSYKGICYYVEEREDLSIESEYERKKSVKIDLIYIE